MAAKGRRVVVGTLGSGPLATNVHASASVDLGGSDVTTGNGYAAGTVPTLKGVSADTSACSVAPVPAASSTTGLTTTAPNPAAAFAGHPHFLWCWAF